MKSKPKKNSSFLLVFLAGMFILFFGSFKSVRAEGEPDLTITKVHTGDFTQAEQGKEYTITVTNIGEGATSGLITVTDILPTGLTATAMEGVGWSCNLGVLTCTRNDVLDGGLSYPDIILTVNVDVDAADTLINEVSVSGDGEIETTNNTASDSTTIIQMPDLIVTNVNITPAYPDPGQPVDVSITVKNQGGDITPSIVYRHVYVDTANPDSYPPDPETGCPSIETDYFRSDYNDGLPPNTSDTKSVSISDGLSAGIHQIWVYTDATCINGESQEANNVYGPISIRIESVPLTSPWAGGITVESDRNLVAVGRPHIGEQVMTYDGFSGGGLTMYVPMLFKNIWGVYNSALYIQNVNTANTANVTIKFYDTNGNLSCTKNDTITALASKGYWIPSETCLPKSWVGGVVITSNQNIVAVGRPHIGDEITTYNGFAGGSTTMYVPMLFKRAFGSYDSALYVQNVDAVNAANITIKFYDNNGNLSCTKNDAIAALSSKGYWLPTETCLPVGWVGGVVITSTRNIVAVGRPHIGAQITTYSGFTTGGLSMSVPMLFKGAFGTYDSALYVQNVDSANTASITIKYYDSDGTLSCTKLDTIAPLASKGYWVPSENCLPAGWAGSAVVTANRNIVAVGRPHLGSEILTYGGFASGGLSSYVPMLFNNIWDVYNAAFYLQNLDTVNPAIVTIKFYDTSGNLSCTRQDVVPALASQGYWMPSVTCMP